MESLIEKGFYGEQGYVYRFYTIEEMLTHNTKCGNWPFILQQAEKYLGCIWVDRNGVVYKIIGVEDNNAWLDYYWILEDCNGDRKYMLVNDPDFEKNIKH